MHLFILETIKNKNPYERGGRTRNHKMVSPFRFSMSDSSWDTADSIPTRPRGANKRQAATVIRNNHIKRNNAHEGADVLGFINTNNNTETILPWYVRKPLEKRFTCNNLLNIWESDSKFPTGWGRTYCFQENITYKQTNKYNVLARRCANVCPKGRRIQLENSKNIKLPIDVKYKI